METLETLTQKIDATEDLRSLTHSMKTLSAINAQQFEQARTSLDQFRKTISMGVQVVLRQHPPRLSTPPRQAAPAVLVVFGSDRGLCGEFNERVAQLALRYVEREYRSRDDVCILAVGGLAGTRLEALGNAPDAVLPISSSLQSLSETCERVLVKLDALQKTHGVHSVSTIYNRKEDDGGVWPSAHVLIPLRLDYLQSLQKAPWPSRRLPTFSAPLDTLFSWLVRQHLFADLYYCALSSLVAENTARLAAMQRAERNIVEKLADMRLDFRRLRQEAITTELLDIVGGYETLRTRGVRGL